MPLRIANLTPKYNIASLLLLTLLVATLLTWYVTRREWASDLDLAHTQLQQLQEERRFLDFAVVASPATPVVNRCKTPEEFVHALRTIENWYEFADRTADAFAKGEVADQAVPDLIELLGDTDQSVRTRATCTLGKIQRHEEKVVPALIPLLQDSVANVRWHAAFALGQFGKKAAAGAAALQQQLMDDSSPIAAFSAEMLLKIEPDADITDRLLSLLRNPIPQNRIRAADALRSISASDEAARTAVRAAYREETDDEVKAAFARYFNWLATTVQSQAPQR